MADDDDDDRHPAYRELCELMRKLDFAERYYTYCSSHSKKNCPDIPLALQTKALDETGRTFRYDKREKFFSWRDSNAPKGCELGLNLSLRDAQANWILVLKTPSGHLGEQFSAIAEGVKRLADPRYQHEPRFPTPDIANATELRTIITEGLALYDDIATALRSKAWK